MKYMNPVIPGFYPDPSICRVDEDFFLVTSSFEYFPGVPIFHSRNLVNWKQIGHCLTRRSQLPLAGAAISGGIYAPTIRYHQGRFYMVTTNHTHGGHFFVWTEDPAGEWSDPIWVKQSGIDPDLFWDDDGRVVFSCTSGRVGIDQSEIDIQTGETLTEPDCTWTGCGGKVPEAPHVYKINGRYYLMIAEGGTEYGHCVTIARGPSPLGPWESCPHNPILTHRSTDLPIQATGHADMVQDQNGNWWMVCLGIRPVGFHSCHILGRETFLTPLKWQDGWPVTGNSGQIAVEMKGFEGLSPVAKRSYSTHDNFDDEDLPLHWNFLGNPADEAWSLTLNPGRLTLHCVKSNLGEIGDSAWIGRRQQHFKFRASACVDFIPRNDHEEAGITVFQNMHHHYDIAIGYRENAPVLMVRRTIGTLSAEEITSPVAQGPITLVIEGDRDEYRLGYASGDSAPVFLAGGETRYLSTEVGGCFTGVYLAMYATAGGHPSDNAAKFDWFDYEA
jgi:xylan 1,4-beta-xylosidase